MKKWMLGSVILLFLLFGGCNQINQNIEDGYVLGYSAGSKNVYSNQGIFQYESRYLSFLDPFAGLESLVCDDMECGHERNRCSAYVEGLQLYSTINQGKLLWLTDYKADKLGDLYLYEADTDGANRKELTFLENIQTPSQVLFTQDKLVISYFNSYDKNLSPLEEEVAGIYVYDMEAGAGNVACEFQEWNARIPAYAVVGENIYFYLFYIDMSVDEAKEHVNDMVYMEQRMKHMFYRLDMQSGDLELLQENVGECQGMSSVGDSIICSFGGKLYQYHVKDKTYRMISEQGFMPKASFLEEEVLLWYENGYYTYSERNGIKYIGRLEDCIVSVAFPNYVYAMDFNTEDGFGVAAYFETKEFLKGNFDKIQHFEK